MSPTCCVPTSYDSSLLKDWRKARKIAKTPESILPSRAQLYLPDKILKTLVDNADHFLRILDVTPEAIRKIVQWDPASLEDLQEVAAVISGW